MGVSRCHRHQDSAWALVLDWDSRLEVWESCYCFLEKVRVSTHEATPLSKDLLWLWEGHAL